MCICGKLLEGTGTIVTCKCQIRYTEREILQYILILAGCLVRYVTVLDMFLCFLSLFMVSFWI